MQKNWNLFSVSVGMAGTGLYQLSRKIRCGNFISIVLFLSLRLHLYFLVETIKQVLNQIQISGMITYLQKKKNLSRNDVIMISNFSLLLQQLTIQCPVDNL
ncbi:hypothetical protein ZIOFF_074940 [Zingiber officinale]|uniref:Uncharacterized protein n=1 Tax=Zingiber officinale TaxID=94328 RepID=A0A8J5C210_ZINOF|nr:hypothetical protein ZIOFF_074940 [Zingiber officinale]